LSVFMSQFYKTILWQQLMPMVSKLVRLSVPAKSILTSKDGTYLSESTYGTVP
jgi:hypothetical protein